MGLCFFQRLSLSLVAIFIAISSLYLYWLADLHKVTKSEAEQRLHLELAAHLVGDSPLLKTGAYDYDALKNLFHTLMILGPNFEFYYVDPNGKVLTYSAKPDKVKRTQIDIVTIHTMLNSDVQLPVFGDDPRSENKQKIFSVAPVKNGDVLQGYLYVIIGGEIYDSIWDNLQQNQVVSQFIVGGMAALVFLLIVIIVLFRWFTMPMRKLANAMEKVRESDFRQVPQILEKRIWDKKSKDEIERLGAICQEMLGHIHYQFETMKNLDDQRRTLLADLSHDLRTPLANLQGYIETLSINGAKLPEDERARFVDISLKNARNLKKLIDQIFELAYLESGQVKLNLETFPLGELLQDILSKFALKADSRHVKLKLEPEKFDFHVYADIGKLERVLTNLIENAIRHTPENGTVTIRTLSQDDSIRVSVVDTGVGISKNEVAFIFDARYQASNSKPDRNLHVGLGLAISKKLIKLQNSDIFVESKLGEGTSFMFDLKRAAVNV